MRLPDGRPHGVSDTVLGFENTGFAIHILDASAPDGPNSVWGNKEAERRSPLYDLIMHQNREGHSGCPRRSVIDHNVEFGYRLRSNNTK